METPAMPSLSPDENPVPAPSDLVDVPTSARVEDRSRLYLDWAAVFAANFVIPVIFG